MNIAKQLRPAGPLSNRITTFGLFILVASSATLFAEPPGYDSPRSSPPQAGYIHQLMNQSNAKQRNAESSSRRIRDAEINNEMRSPINSADENRILREGSLREGPLRERMLRDRTSPMIDHAVFNPSLDSGDTSHRQTDQTFNNQLAGHQVTKNQQASFHDELSFIEREKQAEPQQQDSTRDMITRLGVNLAFVLAIAIGFIFLVRHWQNTKGGPSHSSPENAIRTRHVLRLTNSVSLYVVDVSGSHFLVAIDTGGIKSVKPLVGDFAETYGRSSQSLDLAQPKIHRQEPIIHDESTAEIDEKLIRLLLEKNNKQAA